MTILFFARRFYPLIGGVEKHVFEISKRLIQKGYRVIVITEYTENLPLYEKHQIGIEIYRMITGMDDKAKKWRLWRELWELRNLIRQADIIHCHDVFFWYLPFRFLFSNKKVYTTFHGYESFPIRKKAILVRKLSEILSNGNICIGDFIPKWYKTNPTFISYGAVDIPKGKTKVINNKEKESAIFIGRLHEQTGILIYAKAYELLKKMFPKFELLVVGDGEQKKLLNKSIKTLGFKKDPEKYFDKYHFAFVSRYLSILESFAAKKLVVAVYDNPVKEDYLRMTPFAKWMIIEKTPEKVVERLTEILKYPKKEQKLIQDAYAWVKKQTWDEMVNTYLKLWHI